MIIEFFDENSLVFIAMWGYFVSLEGGVDLIIENNLLSPKVNDIQKILHLECVQRYYNESICI